MIHYYSMDDQGTLKRIMRLLVLLGGIRSYTLDELAAKLDRQGRSVYRYIATLRDVGFVVECTEGRYRIPTVTKPFREMSDLLHFSEEEAYILTRAIHSIDDTNQLKSNLISKLYALYDFDRVVDTVVKPENSAVVHTLMQAIKGKKQVLLRQYRSSHGSLVRDRLVEPFDFTTNYTAIWAYVPEDGANKLFRVSRMAQVEPLAADARFADRHSKQPEDVFRLSSAHTERVVLHLSLRAYNLLIEEFPLAGKYTSSLTDNQWQLDTGVCGYEGVGRFVLGLFSEVKVVESEGFKAYLRDMIKKMAPKF